jgi:hypothetical protein
MCEKGGGKGEKFSSFLFRAHPPIRCVKGWSLPYMTRQIWSPYSQVVVELDFGHDNGSSKLRSSERFLVTSSPGPTFNL